ncbi:cupredoxin domain-containing protein [uncultured Winogradskyella sp.]|uniref:cupredoxin domain-containing protein n=1 Tax=uncultured Winogradskyella sp. TaxID=395353 RepID=UPI0030EC6200|tara:strand:+ start:105 stop:488 length:384 start_codon:yes stop_codon:yes gene_type:complete
MKKFIAIIALALAFTVTGNAQDNMKTKATSVTLEQTKGEFTQKALTLSEGDYIFEIANHNVGKQVGFVLVAKGKDASKPENHIKTAYVTKVVENNTTETSNVTTLTKGEYVYFCPLNETPQYTLTVE